MMKRNARRTRPAVLLSLALFLPALIIQSIFLVVCVAAEFEPYQLNGGLVAAVAGDDFVVIATDTRMIGEGGYQLLSRNHISSRLWSVNNQDHNKLALLSTVNKKTKNNNNIDLATPPVLSSVSTSSAPPTFVGSCGCSADCEELKRVICADLRASSYFHSPCNNLKQQQQQHHQNVNQVATLLSQVLYSRRGFPYYSFCIVAGFDDPKQGGAAKTFVYDAIGSHEQVAVAIAGTGRELLQPILDRQFSSTYSKSTTTTNNNNNNSNIMVVQESVQETISILFNAYRSVCEREIGVGDKLVMVITKRVKDTDQYESSIITMPLKQD